MSRQTACDIWNFRGHLAFPATASGAGTPWVKADTSAVGTPSIAGANGGGVELKFSVDAEVQNLCLYFGDKLAYDIDDLIRAWFIVKTVATLDAATMLAFGMAGARNDVLDSVAQHAWFRLEANNNVVVETDDGTTDLDDKATGLTLNDAFRRFEINFSERVSTQEPPTVSTGGKSHVGFYASNAQGSLRRVASGTRFNMSAYSDGLQPLLQIQKTADANVDSLTVLQVGVEYKLPQ